MRNANLQLDAAYLAKGFFERVRVDALRQTTLLRNSGEIGVMSWLVGFADEIENARDDLDSEATGVWCYDVAEPVGRWIAQYVHDEGEFPTDDAVRAVIREYAKEAVV